MLACLFLKASTTYRKVVQERVVDTGKGYSKGVVHTGKGSTYRKVHRKVIACGRRIPEHH